MKVDFFLKLNVYCEKMVANLIFKVCPFASHTFFPIFQAIYGCLSKKIVRLWLQTSHRSIFWLQRENRSLNH
uniref:Uncharacterized protein n=1 Tax=Lepeophtheirus salmonis TaxID=72036 RepID=A0A0K2TZ10_LEPSM